MPRDERSSSRTSPCPACARDMPTRVLADSVTLIVIGVCPEHGTAELSRVRLVVAEPAVPEPHAFDPYPSDPYPSDPYRSDPVTSAEQRPMASVAYRAGATCGLHLGEGRACTLPAGHGEAHAA